MVGKLSSYGRFRRRDSLSDRSFLSWPSRKHSRERNFVTSRMCWAKTRKRSPLEAEVAEKVI
jgi:hypothetical protein